MSVNSNTATRFQPISILIRLIEIALVMVLAFIAAKAIWFLVYGAETRPSPIEFFASASGPAQLEPQTDLSRLSAVNLFRAREGLAQAETQLAAPQTRLNLTLRGVRTGANAQSGSAVIEAPSLGQRTLAVGMEISDGVTLEEIYADRVIINRRGARESLFLREEGARRTLSLAQAAPTSSAPQTAQTIPAPARPSSAPQSRLTGQPNLELAAELGAEDWIDGLRLAPALEEGAMIGFRVRDNAHLEVLQASGLLPGDIVTTLNGIALTSPEQARDAINLFTQTDTVELDILRNGESVQLALPLDAR